MSHSERAYRLGLKLDFQGILLLMWGATVPLIYYGFACRPALQSGYLCVTSALALACSAATFWPLFSGPHLGHWRAALFGSFGVGSFLAPIAHSLALSLEEEGGGRGRGVRAQARRVGLPWILATLLFNTLGTTAYTFKVRVCGRGGGER